MKSFFKRSTDQNVSLTKKIPVILFNENTHFNASNYSRLTPKFENMLELQHARQMFQKYLRTIRLHDVFQCFLELNATNNCNTDCSFNNNMIETGKNFLLNLTSPSINGEANDSHKNFECILDVYSGTNHGKTCVYVTLYRKYLTMSCNSSHDKCGIDCFDKVYCGSQILAETFLKPQCGQLPSIKHIEKTIGDYLKDVLYPQYLQTHFHQRYQIQLLNSGLNSLRLSDFIYSEEYLMIITEFCDSHGLTQYLFFLLAVIRLSSCSDKCSFQDAIDIYSKFLIMDSDSFLDVPSEVANNVVNSICKHEPKTDTVCSIDVGDSFSSVFKPVYLFLEQFWLPQFLISPMYQKHLNYLSDSINSFNERNRNYSDTATQSSSLRPSELFISEDDNSDISTDNASVQSEPVLISSENNQDFSSGSSWWPSRRLDNRFQKGYSRPMTLGSFDDLGRYQSINSATKSNTNIRNSSSSDILSTISELSNELWSKVQFNNDNQPQNTVQSPDDVARQIINDIHRMTLKNL